MTRLVARLCVAGAMVVAANPSYAAVGARLAWPLRGQNLTLTIYHPPVEASKIKGTVLMASGDVGWVGLAASMADFLSNQGYLVVGINVREYLSAFTLR